MEKSQPTQALVPSDWPGAFGIYKYSAIAVKRNLNTYLLLWAAPIVTGTVLGLIFAHQMALQQVISWLVGMYIGIAIIYTNVASAQGKVLEFDRSLGLATRIFLQMLLLQIVISVVVILGLILLIVPGLILAVRLSLAPYFLADQKLDMTEAIKASWAATKGNSGKVWGLVGVSLLMILPVFTLIGIIATIYLLFMYQAAIALLYMYVNLHNKPADTTPAAQKEA